MVRIYLSVTVRYVTLIIVITPLPLSSLLLFLLTARSRVVILLCLWQLRKTRFVKGECAVRSMMIWGLGGGRELWLTAFYFFLFFFFFFFYRLNIDRAREQTNERSLVFHLFTGIESLQGSKVPFPLCCCSKAVEFTTSASFFFLKKKMYVF